MRKLLCFMLAGGLMGTICYAKIYNTQAVIPLTNNLKFSALQEVARDRDGREIKITVDGKQQTGYKYNFAINEILKGSDVGIIEGYDDGTFKPNNPVGKGDFIKLAISLALGVNNNENGINRIDYYDIPTSFDHYTAKYVAIAEMQGIIEHGNINAYNIDDPITRLEVITILSKIQIKMKGIPQFTDGELPNYTDISPLTDEERSLVLHAARYRLLENMDNIKQKIELRPYANMTRAEVARALMRVY